MTSHRDLAYVKLTAWLVSQDGTRLKAKWDHRAGVLSSPTRNQSHENEKRSFNRSILCRPRDGQLCGQRHLESDSYFGRLEH